MHRLIERRNRRSIGTRMHRLTEMKNRRSIGTREYRWTVTRAPLTSLTQARGTGRPDPLRSPFRR